MNDKCRLEKLLDNLNLSDDEKEQWINTLGKYEFLLIEKRINTCITQSRIPNLKDIVDGLQATHKMPDRRNYKEPCSVCDKMFDYDKIEKHEARCSSIRFLKKKCKKLLNRDIPYDFMQKMWDMSEKEFDDLYCLLVEKFIPFEKNPTLKFAYNKILETKEK